MQPSASHFSKWFKQENNERRHFPSVQTPVNDQMQALNDKNPLLFTVAIVKHVCTGSCT